jgi:DNA-binding IclR family transcriptional regulator
MSTDGDKSYSVRAVERTLALLESLADAGSDGAGLSILARAADLSEPTALRYLATLSRSDVVEHDPRTNGYRLGPGLLVLWERGFGDVNPRRVGTSLMRELHASYGETVNLATFWNGRVILIDAIEGVHALKRGARVGQEDRLHSTGLGKAILAHLPEAERRSLLREKGQPRITEHTITTLPELERELEEVRARGYAIDQEEDVPGLRCVAAPIFDRHGHVSHALSISAATTSMPIEQLHDIGPRLVAVCAEVSRRLGHVDSRTNEREPALDPGVSLSAPLGDAAGAHDGPQGSR